MTFTVRPAREGGLHAFVCDPRLLLVAPIDDSFVAAAWAAVGADDGFQAALDLLTSRGLAATPSFVLIEWEPGETARVIVRGDLPLTVTDASGEQELTAAGVSTWVERSLPGVTAISLTVPGATALGTTMLPVDRGVSLVSGIASERATATLATVAVAPAAPSQAKPAPTTVSPAPTPAAAAVAEPVASAAPAPVEPAPVEPAPVGAALPSPDLEPDIEATVREAPEAPEPPPSAAADSGESEGYDYLFGDTMYRNVADAAVHEPEADPAATDAAAEPAAADEVDDALHDGETVVLTGTARTRAGRGAKSAAAPKPQPEASRVVLVLAPTGAREPLTQPVLMGRSPSVSKVSAGQIPRLVTIGTVDQDISRNHAQFSLEGGTVVITDLHSRNGTTIALPGKSAQKLRPGEPTSVIVGTVVDFGGGVTVTVEEES